MRFIGYLEGDYLHIIRKEAVILFYSLPVELGAYQYSRLYNVYVTLFYKSYKFRIKFKKKKIRLLRITKNSLAYFLI